MPNEYGNFGEALGRLHAAHGSPGPKRKDAPLDEGEDRELSDHEGTAVQIAMMAGAAFAAGSGLDPKALLSGGDAIRERMAEWVGLFPDELAHALTPTLAIRRPVAALMYESMILAARIKAYPLVAGPGFQVTRERPPEGLIRLIDDDVNPPWSFAKIGSYLAGAIVIAMTPVEFDQMSRFIHAAMAAPPGSDPPDEYSAFSAFLMERIRRAMTQDLPVLPNEVAENDQMLPCIVLGLKCAVEVGRFPPIPGGRVAGPIYASKDTILRMIEDLARRFKDDPQ